MKKPTKIIQLTGNAGHRPKDSFADEPHPEISLPKPPTWLGRIGKREWRRVAPQLYELGLLSDLDIGVLATYCHNYEILQEGSKAIKAAGGIAAYLEDKNSQTAPLITVMRTAQDKILQCSTHFGMSPSTRSRMNVKPPEREQQEDALLNGRG
jgi:P27 family predicted phage terminase small subunit